MMSSSLWAPWWNVILLLRPAFSHLQTFLWFATAVAGLSVRTDMFGVTSIVRALKLHPKHYQRLLKHFHSNAVHLDILAAQWTRVVLRVFPKVVRVNGRPVFVGDGIKAPKRGKRMPGVKLLHQQSDNKAEYIMGHSLQAVSVLVQAAQGFMAVPLAMRIHEGLVWSNRDKRTLLDKMLALLDAVNGREPCYLVADAYYAATKVVNGLLGNGSHLVSRVRSNATAYEPYQHRGPKKPGRPKVYGNKLHLAALPESIPVYKASSPLYGERDVVLQYAVRDLLWRPVGKLVRFVNVVHPTRGRTWILLCTDTSLDAIEIIRLYGMRFKIEHSFKQAVHRVGIFSYHFWMKVMKPLQHGSGDQYLHRTSLDYRNMVKEKLHAYHAFLQAGLVAQGMMQYLAATCPRLVWQMCGSWLRTIRPGIAPSEFVVANALRESLPEFLWSCENSHRLAKFILQRQNLDEVEMYRMAS